ncbi:MAG: Holliday junction branch migration protein RuvA [Spirochaetaceae bacterium]|jgi:Holliday junction DNA helicase RuvA|nr:Holliday junction branch migration protein RuvA [Spirochaetaceae bacterium]
MFNRISGVISEKLEGGARILTGGIEWDVIMPVNDARELPPEGSNGTVFCWLHHKEDQMRLFGFASALRRDTFLELLKVEGVGPKAAVKIMGGISQNDLENALETGDLARLTAVPGLGKKTAQKMLLALKGKIVSGGKNDSVSRFNELAEALVQMGYDKKLALDALNQAARASSETPAGEKESVIFREAILYLSS